ncbi:MAG: hypothetical protein EAY75_05695 [Bacteroidetes bacterium]|nr:MAG: hypothetical protein EAY75_05695 [Bacteroidota bacterium]
MHNLRFKAAPGQQTAITAVVKGKMSMNVAGKEVQTNINTQTDAHLQFDTTAAEIYNVRLNYSNFKVEQSIEGFGAKVLTPDSSTSIQMPNNVMEQIKKVAYRLRMNQQGGVVDVEKNDSLFTAVAKAAIPDNDSVGIKVFEMLKPLMNEQMAKGFLEQAFFVYPSKAVNVGDSWTNTMTVTAVFSMTVASEFTLMAITDSSATLAVNSRIKPGNNGDVLMTGLAMAGAPFTQNKLAKSAKGIDVAGMKMKAEFSGTQTGTVELDLKKGRAKTCQLHQLLNGDLTFGIFMLPMALDMTTTYTLTDLPSLVAYSNHHK